MSEKLSYADNMHDLNTDDLIESENEYDSENTDILSETNEVDDNSNEINEHENETGMDKDNEGMVKDNETGIEENITPDVHVLVESSVVSNEKPNNKKQGRTKK